MTTTTHAEFTAQLIDLYGDDPAAWAFICPNCGDVATGEDFRDALVEHPREHRRTGERVTFNAILGQECIGRTVGALTMSDDDWKREVAAGRGRGCSWAAYGLLAGPLFVEFDGREVASFNIATPEVA